MSSHLGKGPKGQQSLEALIIVGPGHQRSVIKPLNPDIGFLELENEKQGRATSCWVTSYSWQEVEQHLMVRQT